MTLTIVVPTQGRETLESCLQSMEPIEQNNYKVDILVVADTYGNLKMDRNKLIELCTEYGARYLEFDAGYNDWGYPQLRQAYKYGRCEKFIMNIGDDDVMVPGIIPRIVHIIERNGTVPYLFQAELWPSPNRGNREPVLLWNDEDRSIKRQKVTGQNFVVPNMPHLLGNMADDFSFIEQTIENWGTCLWIPVCTVRCY